MPFVYDPGNGQDQVNPNKQKQPPALGGSGGGGAAGGGGGQQGYDIPGSSIYQGESAAANMAYEKAKSQLLANRNSLYHQYGLNASGQVDVNNPYGDYQMLLGNEGRSLDAADNDALSRGLGTGGLAMQGETSLMPGIRNEQLGFQRQVDQTGRDYSSGLVDAENTRQSSINNAYQDALASAIANGQFDTASDSTQTTTSLGGSTTKVNKNTPARFNYNPRITANRTGASARKRGGIYSIH